MDHQPVCDNCKTWGKTITREDNPQAIPCPICKRLTWPNLGVNCPAGSAVSFGTSSAIQTLRMLQQQGKLSQPLTIYEKMRIREMEDKHE